MYKNVNTVSDEFVRTKIRQSCHSRRYRWHHYHWQAMRLLCKYTGRCLCKRVDVYIITLSCTWRIYALSEHLLVICVLCVCVFLLKPVWLTGIDALCAAVVWPPDMCMSVGVFLSVCVVYSSYYYYYYYHFTSLWTMFGTTQVSGYQKGKPIWIYCSKILWVAVASAWPYTYMYLTSDRMTMPAFHHQ